MSAEKPELQPPEMTVIQMSEVCDADGNPQTASRELIDRSDLISYRVEFPENGKLNGGIIFGKDLLARCLEGSPEKPKVLQIELDPSNPDDQIDTLAAIVQLLKGFHDLDD